MHTHSSGTNFNLSRPSLHISYCFQFIINLVWCTSIVFVSYLLNLLNLTIVLKRVTRSARVSVVGLVLRGTPVLRSGAVYAKARSPLFRGRDSSSAKAGELNIMKWKPYVALGLVWRACAH